LQEKCDMSQWRLRDSLNPITSCTMIKPVSYGKQEWAPFSIRTLVMCPCFNSTFVGGMQVTGCLGTKAMNSIKFWEFLWLSKCWLLKNESDPWIQLLGQLCS
jgi:hypothetical protein